MRRKTKDKKKGQNDSHDLKIADAKKEVGQDQQPVNIPDSKEKLVEEIIPKDPSQDIIADGNDPADHDIEGGGKDEKAPEDAADDGEGAIKKDVDVEKDKDMDTPKDDENNVEGSPALNTEQILIEEEQKDGSNKQNAPDTARQLIQEVDTGMPKEAAANPAEQGENEHISNQLRRRQARNGKLETYEELFKEGNFQEKAENGTIMTPEQDRQVTDLFFILILIGVLVTLFIMSIYGLGAGHLDLLAAPVDSDGRMCGIGQTISYPNLYYYDLEGNKTSVKYATCVRTCPDSQKFQFQPTDCMKTERVHECFIPYGKSYSTETMFNYCVRKHEDVEMEADRDVYRDFELTGPSIFICLFLAFVYSITFLYVLSSYAKQMVYFLIGVTELLLLLGVIACIYGIGVVQYPAGAWLGLLLFIVLLIGLNIILKFYWADMQIAIAVIDAAADFVFATKRLVLVKFATFIFGFLFIVLWFYGFINIISTNDVQTVLNEDGNYEKDVTWNGSSTVLVLFMVIGLIWMVSFLREQNMFINMYCSAEFYYTSNADAQGSAKIYQAIKTTYKKHIGTVALGSLVHALTALLRVIARRSSSKLDNENKNVVQKCLFCCCDFVDQFIEYLNQMAYAIVAITGDRYCVSAKNGFYLSLKHLEAYWFAKTLSFFLMLFGQFGVSLMNVGTCFLLIKFAFDDSEDIDALWAPLGIIFFATLFTSELFMSIFKQSIITTLMCFAYDLEVHGEVRYGPPDFHSNLATIQADYAKIDEERKSQKEAKAKEQKTKKPALDMEQMVNRLANV